MSTPLMFGAKTEEEKYFEGRVTLKVTRLTQSVKLNDPKKALAEFLTLMDRFNAGEITDFSIACVTGKDGALTRIEKTWVVPDLR